MSSCCSLRQPRQIAVDPFHDRIAKHAWAAAFGSLTNPCAQHQARLRVDGIPHVWKSTGSETDSVSLLYTPPLPAASSKHSPRTARPPTTNATDSLSAIAGTSWAEIAVEVGLQHDLWTGHGEAHPGDKLIYLCDGTAILDIVCDDAPPSVTLGRSVCFSKCLARRINC